MQNFNLTLGFDTVSREITVVDGIRTLYQNSIGQNVLYVQTTEPLSSGDILDVTFSVGGQSTKSLTMVYDGINGQYYREIPQVVLANDGICTIALAVKTPVTVSGTTQYKVLQKV